MDAETAEETNWHPVPLLPESVGHSFTIRDIAVTDSRIYAVGYFSNMNGQRRPGAAAFDRATGALLPWAPNQQWKKIESEYIDSPSTGTVAVVGDRVYISGSNYEFNGEPVDGLVAVDTITGATIGGWQTHSLPAGYYRAFTATILHADEQALFVSDFQLASIGQPVVAQKGFVEIDATTGALTDWRPRFRANNNDTLLKIYRSKEYINAFARHDSILYVGGNFDSVDGQRRSRLCAFNLRTHQLLAWSPLVGGIDVQKLVYANGVVYAAGAFDSVNGVPRSCVAAVDASTGALLAWDAGIDTLVLALAVDAGKVYLAGRFRSVGGTARSGLAVVDGVTGALLNEGPVFASKANVYSLCLSDSTLYVWGAGLPKEITPITLPLGESHGFGGYDRISGALKWRPKFDRPTSAKALGIQYRAGKLIVTGPRQWKINPEVKNPDTTVYQTLVFDGNSGEILEYGPTYDGSPAGMMLREDTLLVWGSFASVSGRFMPAFAWLQPSGVLSVRPLAQGVAQVLRIYPNPATSHLTIEVPAGIGAAGMVQITDVRGERVATGEVAQSGRAVVSVEGLAAGMYFVRCGSWSGRFVIER
jgi:hypothetical protein